MTSEPEQIRRDIESTRQELSANVDALTEKVNPRRAVGRSVEQARHSVLSMKDKIMGPAEHALSSAGDTASSAASGIAERASSAASEATQRVASLPQAARQQAQGNPLAAGLIVFGAGWLVSSLLPTSRTEQELATHATNAVSHQMQPLTQQLGQTAREMTENLREPTQQAAQSLHTTAGQAASTLGDQSRTAAGNVADRAKQAKDTLQN